MNGRMIVRILAYILLIEAGLMLAPLILSAAGHDGDALRGFLVAEAAALLAGGLFFLLSRNAKRRFYAREGMAVVGLSWVAMSLVGALPFCASGRIPRYIDALFEIVSGFTTTGASILSDVEALGHALLLWRSFSHWIGGMGVLVFLLAIIPTSGGADGFTLHILRAESPGPTVNKMVPRMKQSATILYLIYCALTVVDIIALLIAKMPAFDAVCIAFGTAGTGGFGVLNSSMASYTHAAQNITTVFMLLFGVNFGLYYLLLLRSFKAVLRDEELRLYLGMVIASIAVITVNVLSMTPDTMSTADAARHAAFQVSSIVTTTGYSTTNFDLWPNLSRAVLVMLMLVGACGGSTGGGLKMVRALLLCKGLRRNALRIMRPNEVRIVRLNGSRVDEQTLANVNAYLSAYVIIMLVSFLILSADRAGYSMTTNFTAVAATFNNIGPGLDTVGPTCNFGGYSVISKLVMTLGMLLGRLEIFPILALFAPGTYKRSF